VCLSRNHFELREPVEHAVHGAAPRFGREVAPAVEGLSITQREACQEFAAQERDGVPKLFDGPARHAS